MGDRDEGVSPAALLSVCVCADGTGDEHTSHCSRPQGHPPKFSDTTIHQDPHAPANERSEFILSVTLLTTRALASICCVISGNHITLSSDLQRENTWLVSYYFKKLRRYL